MSSSNNFGGSPLQSLFEDLQVSSKPVISGVFDLNQFPESDFQNKRHTDLAIHCQGKTFHAHKVILSAKSEFFSKVCDPEVLPTNQARVNTINLDNYDPLIVKAVLVYCYTGDFGDDKHLWKEEEKDWTQIEKRLHFCVVLYAAARKLDVQGLENAVLKRFRSISTSAFIIEDASPKSMCGRDRLTSAGAGRITRLVFETDRCTNGRFRTLVFCKLYFDMDVLSRRRDFVREVDKLKKSFWKHLMRFNFAIASPKIKCQKTSCQTKYSTGSEQLVDESGLLECRYCKQKFALEQSFDTIDTSASDSEDDESSDEDSTVLLTPSTIC